MNECQIEYCERAVGNAIIEVKFDESSYQFRVLRLVLIGKSEKVPSGSFSRVCDPHRDYIGDILRSGKTPVIRIKIAKHESER